VGAFLNSAIPENRNTYVSPPPGFLDLGDVLLLRKALYGLRDLPKLWLGMLSQILKDLGLKRVDDEVCIWANH
jgi:hypothetical protein